MRTTDPLDRQPFAEKFTRAGQSIVPPQPDEIARAKRIGPALPNRLPHHDGATYNPVADKPRLNAQTARVFSIVCDGRWRTLREIADASGDPEASVSARLRDLRKPAFGGHEVQRRRRGEAKRGLHEYRLAPPRGEA